MVKKIKNKNQFGNTLIDIMALDNLYNFEKFFGVELSKNIKKKIYKQN